MDLNALNAAAAAIATQLRALHVAYPSEPLVDALHTSLFDGLGVLNAQPEVNGGVRPQDGGGNKNEQ